MLRAVGYVRVSSEEQGLRGSSLAAQRTAVLSDVERRGWGVEFVSEVASAGTVRRRPLLSGLLERLDRGEADALVVARLDRLSRSVGDFAQLMDRAGKNGWVIVVLDPAVDMSTPFGEAMAGMAAVFAQLERRLIAQRTRAGIEARKRAGTYRGGKIGNPPRVPLTVCRRIAELAAEGVSLRGIARRLTLEGVPTPGGGTWSHTTVARSLERVNG